MGFTMAEQIAAHEGFRAYVYDDATGRRLTAGDTVRGTPTFGYGFTIVDQEEALEMLSRRVARVDRELKAALPFYLTLSTNRQRVLLDMAYNLGLAGLLRFKYFLAALTACDWLRAGMEMLDSKWATQVGSRARVLARMMRSDLTFEQAMEQENS